MKDLRIALVGSHGTGKTSVVKKLAEITKLPVIEEIARRYDLNTPDMYEYKQYQKQLLIEQIKAEVTIFLSKGSFISDRSSIDNMAYYLLKCKGVSSPEERGRYAKTAMHNALLYTHLFYIPIEFSIPEDDGFRFKGEIFRKDIDNKVNDIFNYYGVDIFVLRGSINERVSTVLEAIEWQ